MRRSGPLPAVLSVLLATAGSLFPTPAAAQNGEGGGGRGRWGGGGPGHEVEGGPRGRAAWSPLERRGEAQAGLGGADRRQGCGVVGAAEAQP